MIARQITPASGRPGEHAVKIAEKVTEAWYSWHGSGDLEVPLSVVAALCFLSPPPPERNELATTLIGTEPEEFAHGIRKLWEWFLLARPDLLIRTWPLMEPWFSEDRPMSKETRKAAKAVGEAALRADLFAMTGQEGLHETDLLGTVLTLLRPKSAIQGRGQYYTPAEVSDVMARLLGAPRAGETVNDPAMGTGGMFRAAAQAMRAEQRDPRTAGWEGNDLDHLAVAAGGVNVVLWGLGHDVLLGVGNTLTADWRDRALAEREEPKALMVGFATLAALHDLDVLTSELVEQTRRGKAGENG